MTEEVKAVVAEEAAKPAEDAKNIPHVPDELEPIVLKRIDAAKKAMKSEIEREMRGQIEEEKRLAALSAEEKAREESSKSIRENEELKRKLVRMERESKLMLALQEVGGAPSAYIVEALSGLGETDEFDAAETAKAIRSRFLDHAKTLAGAGASFQAPPKPVAKTGGAQSNPQDYSTWDSEQAAKHSKQLLKQGKAKEAAEFIDSYAAARRA